MAAAELSICGTALASISSQRAPGRPSAMERMRDFT